MLSSQVTKFHRRHKELTHSIICLHDNFFFWINIVVALYGPFYLFFLRTIGLRFSLYQKLSKLRKKKSLFAFFINLAQDRGVEYVNNHFQKYSMKVTFRKRNLKKTFIYSDYLLKNICQEDPNSHFSLYKVVDRVKTVALWSAKKYIYIKDHKGLRFRS
jgi:predicted DNA-binding protein YlxM (UPF0122 family)